MAHRSVKVLSVRPNLQCIVTFNSEFKEYRSRMYVHGIAENAADYFTDCKEDAIATGQAMLDAKHAAMQSNDTEAIAVFHREYCHA